MFSNQTSTSQVTTNDLSSGPPSKEANAPAGPVDPADPHVSDPAKETTGPAHYLVGLDLAQMSDYTAIAVLARRKGPDRLNPAQQVYHYTLEHMERLPLLTPYTAIVDYVVSLFAEPPLRGQVLAVDKTGVGAPVVDMFKAARPQCRIVPVGITGGESWSKADGEYRVAKCLLASMLQVLWQSERIKIAKSLPETALLVRELSTFSRKLTPAGSETAAAWREKDHDDLVLATVLAAFVGEHVHTGGYLQLRNALRGAVNPEDMPAGSVPLARTLGLPPTPQPLHQTQQGFGGIRFGKPRK